MTYTAKRPQQEDASDYFHIYIKQVADDDFLQALQQGYDEMVAFLQQIPGEKWSYRYAPGKWSVAEVLLHLIDTERIMAYRALRIARNDTTPLPGFEQDDYIPFCNAGERSSTSIIEEYRSVRMATLSLFKQLDDAALQRAGTASNSPFTPRSLGFIIVGHQIHHLGVLKERYGV